MIIVDCSNLTALDYSAAEAFYHGAESLKHADISLKLCGLTVSLINCFRAVKHEYIMFFSF